MEFANPLPLLRTEAMPLYRKPYAPSFSDLHAESCMKDVPSSFSPDLRSESAGDEAIAQLYHLWLQMACFFSSEMSCGIA